MFGVIDFWAYLLGVISIVLLPGPNSLYVLAVAARHGVRKAYLGALGIFLGDTILMVLTVAGAASVLRANAKLFVLFKIIGAAYLAWVGLKLLYAGLTHKRKPLANTEANETIEQVLRYRESFTKALIISLLNPKAIFFFLSFFIQFVDPAYPYPFVSFTILGVTVQIASALYLSCLIFTGARLASLFQQRRWLAVIAQSAAGLLFIGFGVKLAL